MSFDTGFSRHSNSSRDLQPVAIIGVDPTTRTATAITRTRHTLSINCAYATGDTITVPAAGEQWYVERFDMEWRLYGRIPFNDPTLAIAPEEGQVSVGSARGPLELNGTEVRANNLFRLNSAYYRDSGAGLERSTDKLTWSPVAGLDGVAPLLAAALTGFQGTDQTAALKSLGDWSGTLQTIIDNFAPLWDGLCTNDFVNGLKNMGFGDTDLAKIGDGLQNFVDYLFGILFCNFDGHLDPQTALSQLRDLLAPLTGNPFVKGLQSVAEILGVSDGHLLTDAVSGATNFIQLIFDILSCNWSSWDATKLSQLVAITGLAGGAHFHPADIIKKLTDLVSKLLGNTWVSAIQQLVDTLGLGSNGLLEQLLDGTAGILNWFLKIVKTFLPFVPWESLLPFVDWDAVAATHIADLTHLFDNFDPASIFGSLLESAAELVEWLRVNIFGGIPNITDFFDNLTSVLGLNFLSGTFNPLTAIGDFLDHITQKLRDWVKEHIFGGIPNITDFFDNLTHVFGMDFLSGFNPATAISTFIENIRQHLKDWFKLDFLGSHPTLLAWYQQTILEPLGELGSAASDILSAITSWTRANVLVPLLTAVFGPLAPTLLESDNPISFIGTFFTQLRGLLGIGDPNTSFGLIPLLHQIASNILGITVTGSPLEVLNTFFTRLRNMFGGVDFLTGGLFNFGAAGQGFIESVLSLAPTTTLGSFLTTLEDTGVSLAEKVAQAVIRAIRGIPFVGPGIADTLEGLVNGLVDFVRSNTRAGTNLLPDPGVEVASFWSSQAATVTRVTTTKRSGTASLRLTSGGATAKTVWWNVNDLGDALPIITKPGDVFYAECWVFAPTANTGTGIVTLVGEASNSLSGETTELVATQTVSKNDWFQLSGTITIPTGYDRVRFGFRLGSSATTSNDLFYLDDMAVKEITGIQNAIDNIHQGILGGTSTGNPVGGLKGLFQNLNQSLFRSDTYPGATGSIHVDAVPVFSLNTGRAKIVDLQSVIDNIHHSVTGRTDQTGNDAATVRTNLFGAWSSLFDAFNRSSGSANKTPSDAADAAKNVVEVSYGASLATDTLTSFWNEPRPLPYWVGGVADDVSFPTVFVSGTAAPTLSRLYLIPVTASQDREYTALKFGLYTGGGSITMTSFYAGIYDVDETTGAATKVVDLGNIKSQLSLNADVQTVTIPNGVTVQRGELYYVGLLQVGGTAQGMCVSSPTIMPNNMSTGKYPRELSSYFSPSTLSALPSTIADSQLAGNTSGNFWAALGTASPTVVPSKVKYFDWFDRSASSTLGSNWVKRYGNGLAISSSAAVANSSTGTSINTYAARTNYSDQSVSASFGRSGYGAAGMLLTLRGDGNGNFTYARVYKSRTNLISGQFTSAQIFSASAFSQPGSLGLGGISRSIGYSNNDLYTDAVDTWTFRALNNTYYLYRNGSQVDSWTDFGGVFAVKGTSKEVGLGGIHNTTNAVIDNFSAEDYS